MLIAKNMVGYRALSYVGESIMIANGQADDSWITFLAKYTMSSNPASGGTIEVLAISRSIHCYLIGCA